ncbi:hypothetical protein AWB82_07156 [Caballeronia glebae]|uniref:Uncharacterized protein n=1 Tax=Caballeronia glebae TaxID=1777143 RepID=A0A158DSZ4_9BURK|nr:hypothetical protein AWB82_07156 [Caballeronia glebae]
MRLCGVRALARHRNPEARTRRHDRPTTQAEMSGRQTRPIVHAEHGLGRKPLEQPVIDHLSRARAAFFAWLKDEVHAAGQLRQCFQNTCGAKQHHRMPVHRRA